VRRPQGLEDDIGPLQRLIYSKIVIGEATAVLAKQKTKYDVIHLGDVIEHMSKKVGIKLLRRCKDLALKGVIVATPAAYQPQGAAYGNDHEKHHCLWTVEDFKEVGGGGTVVVAAGTRAGRTLVATLPPGRI